MNEKLKKVANIIVLALVTCLVLYFSLKDNFNTIINEIINVNIFWLVISFLLALSFWFFKAIATTRIANIFKKDYSIKQGMRLVLETNFFHAITPFAVGGQPYEIYSLKKSKLKIDNYKEIAGKGIEYTIKKDKYFVGRSLNPNGFTQVDVTKNDSIIGSIYLLDDIKEDSASCINQLKELGIKTTMLTGDNKAIANKVCSELGIDEYRAELLPDDKYNIIDNEKKESVVAFVGDGINDAPALTLSDVGISMGIMGSQASIESSDVVIADDNLARIPDLIKISKRTRKIVLENIIFAGVTKLTFLLLGALGITGMLLAVFADVGVTLIAILNSLRVLSYKIKEK